ncbi:MAG: hypothetical protein WD011_00380 [Nitriliruptoraceae bacterium]
MGRQLLWVGMALLAAPLLVFATAPELWGGVTANTLGVYGAVMLAGAPGLVVLVVAATRRRRQMHDAQD